MKALNLSTFNHSVPFQTDFQNISQTQELNLSNVIFWSPPPPDLKPFTSSLTGNLLFPWVADAASNLLTKLNISHWIESLQHQSTSKFDFLNMKQIPGALNHFTAIVMPVRDPYAAEAAAQAAAAAQEATARCDSKPLNSKNQFLIHLSIWIIQQFRDYESCAREIGSAINNCVKEQKSDLNLMDINVSFLRGHEINEAENALSLFEILQMIKSIQTILLPAIERTHKKLWEEKFPGYELRFGP